MNSIYETWATKRLAVEFTRIVTRDIGTENISEVNRCNATPEYSGCCASHDFCDSNSSMIEAFICCYAAYPIADSEYDSRIINAAWDLARKSGFDISRINGESVE